MALKNNWKDLVDGESFVEVEPINRIAHAVIANEENILSVQNLSESIQADNESQEARINELSENLIRLENNSARLDSKTNENEKRITNLEKGIPSDLFLTDSSIAYSKSVPQNALPYAEVRKIGGATRKCTNLCKRVFDGSNVTISDGVVTQVTADTAASPYAKAVTYAGDSIEKNISVPASNIGGISLTFDKTNATVLYFGINGSAIDTTVTMDISHLPAGTYTIGANFTNLTQGSISWKDMILNEGSTALPYEPYFDGLRSAPVTEVESVGANLIPYPYSETTVTKGGVTFTDKGDGGVAINGTATDTLAFYLCSMPNDPLPIGYYSVEANGVCEIRCYHDGGTATTFASSGGAINITKPIVQVALLIREGQTYNGTVYPMFNEGSTALPYRPYQRHTLPIPEAVQALDGYGDGVNESVYNYIDFETKQFVKRVGKIVFDGSADEVIHIGVSGSEYTLFYVYMGGNYSYSYSPAITNYDLSYEIAWDADSAHFYVSIDSVMFAIPNSMATSLETVRAHLASNPLVVYYELAAPEITDISDIVSEDNFIGVEGNGTITMINQYKYNVPSEIAFMLNEV